MVEGSQPQCLGSKRHDWHETVERSGGCSVTNDEPITVRMDLWVFQRQIHSIYILVDYPLRTSNKSAGNFTVTATPPPRLLRLTLGRAQLQTFLFFSEQQTDLLLINR